MRIGEIAEQAGIATSTLRYYERANLLPPPDRDHSGYRDYDSSALVRIGFIRDAQAAGLTLSQIRSVLEIRDRGEAPCDHVRALIDRRLDEVRDRIAALETTRSELRRLQQSAASVDPGDCDETSICRILQT